MNGHRGENLVMFDPCFFEAIFLTCFGRDNLKFIANME